MRLSADCFVAIYDSADESMSFFGLLLSTAHCPLLTAHCSLPTAHCTLLRRAATFELSPGFQAWDEAPTEKSSSQSDG
jgi:hypothetical protein